MAIGAGTGKQCTIKIGTTDYTPWTVTVDVSGNKSSSTEATWGEDVQFTGTPEYTATIEGMFDPSATSFGAVLEDAFESGALTTFVATYLVPSATRTFTNWRVVSYSDNAPADGLVKFTAEISGSAMWATVYDTP